MKNRSVKLISFLLVTAFSFLVVFQGCKKDDDPALEIPPESTFLMDFSDFSSADDTTNSKGTKSVQTYKNWGHSFVNIAVWSAVITVGLAVPVASFKEAFNHEAIYHPDEKTWTWSYNFDVNGTHEAELTGYVEEDSVVWEMRIDTFLWYYGRSHVDISGGYWILNESKNQQTQLLKIVWNRNSDDGTADITYTNVAPAGSGYHDNNGGYISYGITTGEYDRYYDIYNKWADNLTEIEWNASDKYGRIRDFKKFGDMNWHCWDTTLQDSNCQ